MQSHPVELLLPAFPVPECHRVRQRAIVEIVAVLYVRSMTLHSLHQWQRGRQCGVHRVPRKVYAHAILKIPVYARGNAYVVVASYNGLAVTTRNLEEVGIATNHLCHNLARRPLVDTLKQALDRGSGKQS